MNAFAAPPFVLAGILMAASCQDPVAPPAAPLPPEKQHLSASAAPVKPGKLTVIGLTEFFPRQQAGTILLYDARPSFVVAFGRIPGAIPWRRADFEAMLPAHEPEIRAAAKAGKPVVIYCTDAACPDSRAMAGRLAAKGYDVSILDGGYAAWKEAGLPTE
jgi:rhodanese-related sulfurtransferase